MSALKHFAAAVALGAAFTLTAGAQAADLGGHDRLDSHWDPESGYGDNWGPGWVLRFRSLYVVPDEDTSDWRANAPLPAGPDVSISNSVVPEADISYFFNRHLAAEVILGVTPHDIDGKDGIAGLGKVGDAWLLPATVLLQYHFDSIKGVKPYVGAGVNYTVFFDEKAGPNYRDFKLDNEFGWALQAGVDIPIDNHWFLNVDVKKIFLETTAQVDLGATHIETDARIDPWVIGFGVGYRFGGAPALLK